MKASKCLVSFISAFLLLASSTADAGPTPAPPPIYIEQVPQSIPPPVPAAAPGYPIISETEVPPEPSVAELQEIIQRQKQIIEEQKERIEELKDENDKLQRQIQNLQTKPSEMRGGQNL